MALDVGDVEMLTFKFDKILSELYKLNALLERIERNTRR